MSRARDEGVERIETLSFRSGLHPAADMRDVRTLRSWLPGADIVHVHRGKEHWLAAIANRLSPQRRPLVRTRHIVQPIRPHAFEPLALRPGDGSRRDGERGHPPPVPRRRPGAPRSRGGAPGRRGRRAIQARARRRRSSTGAGAGGRRAARGALVRLPRHEGPCDGGRGGPKARRLGTPFHLLFVGQGPFEAATRESVARAGLGDRVSFLGFVDDPARVVGSLDIALYPPLESDGMSRVLFEYLAAGRAVIASRVGVAAEVLTDDESALLVPGATRPSSPRPSRACWMTARFGEGWARGRRPWPMSG